MDLSEKSLKALLEIKDNFDKEEKQRQERRELEYLEQRKRRLERKRTHGFRSADEMIQYVLQGNEIVHEDDFRTRMKLLPSGEIQCISEDYSEFDMPLGYSAKIRTIDWFKAWAKEIEEYHTAWLFKENDPKCEDIEYYLSWEKLD